jgi:hypothetical protein
MDSLTLGSIQSWLIWEASALGPLIVLLVGFAGTELLLRRQLRGKRGRTPLEGAKGAKTDGRG